MDQSDKIINFDFTESIAEKKLIKVIGVGGAGGNAVTHIYTTGLEGVSYLLLNTDQQDLVKSGMKEVAVIGEKLTQGLGAGSDTEIGERAAKESEERIRTLLNDGQTQMVFICAGMGGGTGTGAAPVIASIARDMGLLTVGFIFMPFRREERRRMLKAIEGAEKMKAAVDSLIVINNENINQVYGDLPWEDALNQANEILANAVHAITMVITSELAMNQDFADVRTTLKDGGIAHISIGYGEGSNRVNKAINSALNSPLLNNDDIKTATRLQLALFYDPAHELTTDEMNEIRRLTSTILNLENNKSGHALDDTLGEKVRVVIIAAGFNKKVNRGFYDPDPTGYIKAIEKRKQEAALLAKYYGKDTDSSSTLPTFIPILLTDEELDRDDLINYLEDTPAKDHDILEFTRLREEYKYRNQTPSSSEHLETTRVSRAKPDRGAYSATTSASEVDTSASGETKQEATQSRIITW